MSKNRETVTQRSEGCQTSGGRRLRFARSFLPPRRVALTQRILEPYGPVMGRRGPPCPAGRTDEDDIE